MTRRWYEQPGAENDVVISTRVRLARNLAHQPFPACMTVQQKEAIVSAVFEALPMGEGQAFSHQRMNELTETAVGAMMERHLISPDFTRRGEGEALLLAADEGVSIMVNEEDHLRIQVMRSGLDLEGAYREADCWDNFLDTRLQFAFDERLGYLTQCPSNLGTGMRASVMLHLPALQERGIVQQLATAVSRLGLTIRGMYGEGSKSEGAIYQLSNQVTLGITEQEAIENLMGIARQLIKEERHWREELGKTPAMQDRIFRSLGILQNARLLTGKEGMSLLSHVRVGVALGQIQGIDLQQIDLLLVQTRAATLSETVGRSLGTEERDILRAQLVRETIKEEK